jgi:elongation factor 3
MPLVICRILTPPPFHLWRNVVPADFEYECAWQGLASIKFNRWITRAELVEKGFRKFVTEFDQRLAASALGNDARPLSKETITKFLQDFGLDPEFGVHSNIRGLSGGCACCDSAQMLCYLVAG